MTCIYWLRRQTNIAFDGEMAYDREYLARRCFRLDLKLTLKTFIALCYGRGPRVPFQDHISILGTPIDNITMNEALNRIEQTIDTPAENSLQISFVNPDCLNKACTDAGYRRVLKTSDLVLADGIGLRIAGSLLHRPVRENVNGTDMFPLLCARLNQRGGRLFLLGARAEIVAAVADWVRIHHPQVVVCGARDGYFARNAPVIEQINQAQPDVLLVAMGAPKQEAWIALHRHELNVKVCLGVGGLFDFYSGHTPRAPLWLREIGLEWTYRLYQEPGRMWRRYLIGNLVFLARVLRERFGAPQPAVSKVPVSR
jgi:N-acetylglucosaminyldiphosphoundecaprenol N-acetyl-beta-D-mannosaminyltransferase